MCPIVLFLQVTLVSLSNYLDDYIAKIIRVCYDDLTSCEVYLLKYAMLTRWPIFICLYIQKCINISLHFYHQMKTKCEVLSFLFLSNRAKKKLVHLGIAKSV